MPQQKRGLGKGLGALIPTASPTAAADPGQYYPAAAESQAGDLGAYFEEIPVGAITPNPRQPRQVFDEETLEELAASIRAVGLLQPVVVRKVMPGHYELIMGERRWRACELAGLVPDSGHRQGDVGRRSAPGCADREPAPGAAEPARGGRRLPAAARRLLRHSRGAGPQGGQVPAAHLEHHPAAEPARWRPEASGRRRARAPGTPGRCSVSTTSNAQEQLAHRIVAEGLSVRAVEEIVALGAQAPRHPASMRRDRSPWLPGSRTSRTGSRMPSRPG